MVQVNENLIKPLLISHMRSGKPDDSELFEKYAAIGVASMQRLVKIEMRERALTVFERIRELYTKTAAAAVVTGGKKTRINEAVLSFMLCGVTLIFSGQEEEECYEEYMEISTFVYSSLQ